MRWGCRERGRGRGSGRGCDCAACRESMSYESAACGRRGMHAVGLPDGLRRRTGGAQGGAKGGAGAGADAVRDVGQ